MSRSWYTCFKRLDIKLVPWSVKISRGNPTLEKNWTNEKATILAFTDFKGNTSGYLVP